MKGRPPIITLLPHTLIMWIFICIWFQISIQDKNPPIKKWWVIKVNLSLWQIYIYIANLCKFTWEKHISPIFQLFLYWRNAKKLGAKKNPKKKKKKKKPKIKCDQFYFILTSITTFSISKNWKQTLFSTCEYC
jgi:hypothetical protein